MKYCYLENHSMNKSKNVIYTNNYIPYRPRLYTNDEKYNKSISDLDDYFAKVKLINFDLINNQCRGDELKHDREDYETLFKKKNIDSEIVKSLRQDVRLEKDLQQAHRKVITHREKCDRVHFFASRYH